VVWARDGEEALDYLIAATDDARDGDVPAAMLVDLSLPLIDGYELLRRVRANPHTRHIPVFIFTGSQREADLARAYALGCNCFSRKPTRFASFVEVLRHMDWLVPEPHEAH
jgi:CheY-like chemotaxis protein